MGKIMRRTLQADPEFIRRLKQIKGKIEAENGDGPSLTDLTRDLIKTPAFDDVEKEILERGNNFDIKIKLDGKLKR